MSKVDQSKIYDPKFVSELFDKMSASYGITNYLSSFGFTERWRKKCVNELGEKLDDKMVIDIMSGMGELWHSFSSYPSILKAVDISPIMNKKAKVKASGLPFSIKIIEEDILQNSIPTASADIIISSFGLKTFNNEQLERLSNEVSRILKPGGKFSFVEISKPNGLMKYPYMLYLHTIIPLIGFLFMGNDNSYKYLGKYCSNFKDSSIFQSYMVKQGLNAEYKSYFFGCATGVSGNKSSNGDS